MTPRKFFNLCLAASAGAMVAGCASMTAGEPVQLAAQPCARPPVMHCPDADCGRLVVEQGPVQGPADGRRYFLDYPCDLRKNEKVTVVMSLHGFGSYGNWQRNYFPVMDYVDRYRLVVITPNSPTQFWSGPADDKYLQDLVSSTISEIGAKNVKAFWLAGHSQGGLTSRRVVCSDFFKDKVDGFLSLSGGRVGGQPPRSPAGFGPAPQRNAATPAAPPAGAATPGAAARPAGLPPAATAGMPQGEPACDFSHIYTTGEHEIGSLPDASDWAAKFGCKARVRRPDIVDVKAGYVYDTSRQDPATKGWGRPAAPGTAQVYEWTGCRDGKVIADIERMDKGHTEGLEPKVTEELVKLMTRAKGGKLAARAS